MHALHCGITIGIITAGDIIGTKNTPAITSFRRIVSYRLQHLYIMKLNRLCDALSGVLFHQHELNARRHCACMEDHVKGDEGDHLN